MKEKSLEQKLATAYVKAINKASNQVRQEIPSVPLEPKEKNSWAQCPGCGGSGKECYTCWGIGIVDLCEPCEKCEYRGYLYNWREYEYGNTGRCP